MDFLRGGGVGGEPVAVNVEEIVDMSDKTEEVIPGFSVGVDYVEVVHCSYVVVYMRMIINGVFCVGSVNVGNNVRMC